LCLVIAIAVLSSVLAGCSSGDADEADNPTGEPNSLSILNSRGESVRLSIEIADTAEERNIGLSGRDSLAEDAGMLFVFQQRSNGFWMKDTTIPLSVAFIDTCGEIVAIADMEPLSLELVNPREPYSFGLEVNQGWFRRNAIGVGDQVVLPVGLRPPSCE
jgi:uncharacterized membrane protein (UPF0127 family)